MKFTDLYAHVKPKEHPGIKIHEAIKFVSLEKFQ